MTKRRGKNRRVAAAIGALLIPMAFLAYVMGLWKLASDLNLAGEFGLTGVLSHWQIWIAVALALSFAASALSRYGRGGELEESRVVTPFPHPQPGETGLHRRWKTGSRS